MIPGRAGQIPANHTGGARDKVRKESQQPPSVAIWPPADPRLSARRSARHGQAPGSTTTTPGMSTVGGTNTKVWIHNLLNGNGVEVNSAGRIIQALGGGIFGVWLYTVADERCLQTRYPQGLPGEEAMDAAARQQRAWAAHQSEQGGITVQFNIGQGTRAAPVTYNTLPPGAQPGPPTHPPPRK